MRSKRQKITEKRRKYKVRCVDHVYFDVIIEARSVTEAREEAQLKIRDESKDFYDFVSVSDDSGEKIWERGDCERCDEQTELQYNGEFKNLCERCRDRYSDM